MSCSSGFLPSLSAVDEYGIISDEVPVAQWIERVPPEHETAGSSPAVSVKSHSPLPKVSCELEDQLIV